MQFRRKSVQPIPRIQQYLDRAFAQANVVWLCAPPGAGKTTQLADYAETQQIPTRWIHHRQSMDVDILISFVHEFSSSPPLVRSLVVLDDLDGLSEQSLTRLIEALMELPHSKLQWVLVTTCRPPAKVVRAQARSDLSVLDWRHLRLLPDEADMVLQSLGWQEPPPGALFNLIDGWVAGLALLGPADEGFLNGARMVSAWRETVHRFMTTQVIDRMSPAARDVLFNVAMLDQFCAEDLCSITGEAFNAQALTMLADECLFVESSDLFRYRLHPLFRQVTQASMSQWLDPLRIRRIWAASAPVLERSGDWRGAASCLARLNAQQDLAQLLRRVADGRRHHEDPDAWLRCLAILDESVLEGAPDLQCSLGHLLVPRDSQQAMRYLIAALRRDAMPAACASRVMALCAILEIEIDRLGPRRAFMDATRALVDLHESSALHKLDFHLRMLTQSCVSVCLSQSNDACAASRELVMATLDELHNVSSPAHQLRCAVLLLRAAVALSAPLARRIVYTYEALVESDDCDPQLAMDWCSVAGSWHLEQGGDLHAAHKLAVRGLTLAQSTDRCHGHLQLLDLQLRLALAHGATGTAADIIDQMSSPECRVEPEVHSRVEMAKALLSLSIGDVDAGLGAAESVCDDPLKLATQPLALARFRREVAVLCAAADESEIARHWIDCAIRDVSHGVHNHISRGYRDYIHLLAEQGEARDLKVAASVAQVHARLQVSGVTACLPLTPTLASRVIHCALTSDFVEFDGLRRVISRQALRAPGPWVTDWPWPIAVRVFGGIEVRCSGELVQSAGKAQQRLFDLLTLLAVSGPTGRTQHFLEGHFWGDSENPKAALNVAIYRLRKMLGNEQAVLVHGGFVALNPGLVWTDVRALGSLTDKIFAMDGQQRQSQTESLSVQLLSIYRGPLEAGEDLWLAAAGKRLGARLAEAVSVLGNDLEGAGAWILAGRLYRGLLDVEPLSELAFRGLMRCAHAQGDSGAAAGLFRFCRQTLSILVNSEPNAQTTALATSLGLTIPTRHAQG